MNDLNGANGETSAAAVAKFIDHACGVGDELYGIGGADFFAGTIALRRTGFWVKFGFAEMGIFAIIQADHEPRFGFTEGFDDTQRVLDGVNNGRVSGDVDAVGSGEGKGDRGGAHGGNVLGTGSANEFEPGARSESIQRRGGMDLSVRHHRV
jgi:hypothetical protein